jgi:nucleoside-diphosphate-sugar epimerase
MRLLLTGGAGTLGLQIIEKYINTAESINVIDNFSTSTRDAIKQYKNLNLVEGTISSEKLVKSVFRACLPTHVIHLAASYKNPDDWQEDIETNILGTAVITKLSQEFQIEKLIYIQTVLCYGRPDSLPIKVDSALKPITSYSISKVAGENYIAHSGLNFASLRLGNVISPGLAIGPIPNFYKKLMDGEIPTVTDSIRDFLDIADFLSAFDKVLQINGPSGIFNISTGTGTSMMQIYQLVARYLNSSIIPKSVSPFEDDVPAIILDPSESIKLLNWKPTIRIEESIENCLDHYKKFGIKTVFSHLKRSEK